MALAAALAMATALSACSGASSNPPAGSIAANPDSAPDAIALKNDADVPAATTGSAPVSSAATPAPAGAHSDAPGIAWFPGDVAAAFKAAQAQHKPVLLYWGAVWCPPCQQLKATVFNRADFIDKSKLFVPVYLDGDDAGAQKWGEQFKVAGYPTLLVLDGNQHEVQRIAGGMDLVQFADVLDNALADLQPIDALLKKAAAGQLAAGECHRLAYNGWVLGDASDDATKQAATLELIARHCPADATLDRSRLLIVAAYFRSNAAADALKAGKKIDKEFAARIRDVAATLDDPKQVSANGDVLLYLGEEFFKGVKQLGAAGPKDFAAKFSAAMDTIGANERLAEADRLGALATKLQAAKFLSADDKLPPDVAKEGQEKLDAVLAEKQIPYVRSGILNAALPIFDMLGENERAYTLIEGELTTAKAPYYFKADLADLAEQLGRKEVAVKWLAEAYEEAQGPATRFQWGTMYVRGLLRLQPADSARIQSAGVQVLGELAGPDRMYRRPRLELERLGKELVKWNASAKGAHADVLKTLHARMQSICVGLPAGDVARRSCDGFLAGAV